MTQNRIGMLFRLTLLLSLSVAVSGCRLIYSPMAKPATTAPTTQPVYVSPRDFDFKSLIGDPPADASPEHVAEVDLMLALQASRTPEDVRRCQQEEEVTVFAFSTVLGSRFSADNLPQSAELMQVVYDQAKSVSADAKTIWNRTRPPLADPRIRPCVKFENSFSYPSGHAVRGVVWATLLAEIFPDRRDALMARGKQIGDDRFMAGMHFPTDVAAGQKLGVEVAKKLLANPKFQAELEKVKTECLNRMTTPQANAIGHSSQSANHRAAA